MAESGVSLARLVYTLTKGEPEADFTVLGICSQNPKSHRNPNAKYSKPPSHN